MAAPSPSPKTRRYRDPTATFWERQILRTFWHAFIRGSRFRRIVAPNGRALLIALAFSALFCADPNRHGARIVFSVLLMALFLSLLWGYLQPIRGLRFSRETPAFVRAGTPFSYRLVASNPSRRAVRFLEGRDGSAFTPPLGHQWRAARRSLPGQEQLNAFDRWIGYGPWLWLALRSQSVEGGRFGIAQISARDTVSLPLTGLARERGLLTMSAVWIGARDPFGLFRRVCTFSSVQQLPSLPPSGPRFLPRSALGNALGESLRESETPAPHGDSFSGLRLWRPSDGRRSIAWRASERAGTLMAREWTDPSSRSLVIALDPRASVLTQFSADALDPRHIFDALIAAAFDWAQERPEFSIAFFFEGEARLLPALDSRQPRAQALAQLAQAQPIEGEFETTALTHVLSLAAQRSASSLLATTLFDSGSSHALLILDPQSLGDVSS